MTSNFDLMALLIEFMKTIDEENYVDKGIIKQMFFKWLIESLFDPLFAPSFVCSMSVYMR